MGTVAGAHSYHKVASASLSYLMGAQYCQKAPSTMFDYHMDSRQNASAGNCCQGLH